MKRFFICIFIVLFAACNVSAQETCELCKGSGKHKCIGCGGIGYYVILQPIICNICQGTGLQPCLLCGGKGVINKETSIANSVVNNNSYNQTNNTSNNQTNSTNQVYLGRSRDQIMRDIQKQEKLIEDNKRRLDYYQDGSASKQGMLSVISQGERRLQALWQEYYNAPR